MRVRGEQRQAGESRQKGALAQFWLLALALACMLAGAAHASAHDDDHDHEEKPGAECIICVIASLSGAKLAPGGDVADLATALYLPHRIALTDESPATLTPLRFPRSRGPPISIPAV